MTMAALALDRILVTAALCPVYPEAYEGVAALPCSVNDFQADVPEHIKRPP